MTAMHILVGVCIWVLGFSIYILEVSIGFKLHYKLVFFSILGHNFIKIMPNYERKRM